MSSRQQKRDPKGRFRADAAGPSNPPGGFPMVQLHAALRSEEEVDNVLSSTVPTDLELVDPEDEDIDVVQGNPQELVLDEPQPQDEPATDVPSRQQPPHLTVTSPTPQPSTSCQTPL